jgi:hypothetical protein
VSPPDDLGDLLRQGSFSKKIWHTQLVSCRRANLCTLNLLEDKDAEGQSVIDSG